MSNTANNKIAIFSSLLRFALGVVFIIVGIVYWKEGGWPAIIFGGILFITGFFRPKRCLEEGCDLPSSKATR
jgi:hypothetical protein